MVGGLLSYSYGEVSGEAATIRVPATSGESYHRWCRVCQPTTTGGDKNASYLGRCWRFCGVWAVSALVSTLGNSWRKNQGTINSTILHHMWCRRYDASGGGKLAVELVSDN